MNVVKILSYVSSFACMVCLASTACGAALFVEDFSDGSPAPNMALGVGGGSPTTDFTDDFTVTSEPGSRIYLGTNDTDYSTIDFVFEADITINDTSDWSIAFFGMGNPDADPTAFHEPVTGPNLLGTLWPRLENSNSKDNRINDGGATVEDTDLGSLLATHHAKLTWNSSTGMGRFEFDINSNGTVESSFTLDGSDNGFDATNSQLIVGGGAGITFDNIVVSEIPEPNGLALLFLACVGSAFARRPECS